MPRRARAPGSSCIMHCALFLSTHVTCVRACTRVYISRAIELWSRPVMQARLSLSAGMGNAVQQWGFIHVCGKCRDKCLWGFINVVGDL